MRSNGGIPSERELKTMVDLADGGFAAAQ